MKEFLELKAEGNNLFIKDKNYSAALKKYDEALTKASTPKEMAMIHSNKGMAYEAMKDTTNAIFHYEESIRLDPDHFRAMKRMAKLCVAIEDYDNARKALVKGHIFCRKNLLDFDDTISKLWKKVNAATAKPRAAEFLKKIETENNPIKPLLIEIEEYLSWFVVDPISLMWKGKWPVRLPSESDTTATGFKAAVKALQERDYDKIIGFCDEELADDVECSKEYAEAYLLRGTFRFLWGYGTKCEEDFLKVMNSQDAHITNQMRSSAAVKWALYCQRWMEYRNSTEADINIIFERFKKSLDLWEENCDSYFHQGKIFFEDFRHYPIAKSQYEKALKLCPPGESNVLYQTAVYFAGFFNFCPIQYVVDGTRGDELPALLKLEPKFDVDYCYYLLDYVLRSPIALSENQNDATLKSVKKKIEQVQSKDPRKMITRMMGFGDGEKALLLTADVKRLLEMLQQLSAIREKYGDFADVVQSLGAIEFKLGPMCNWALAFEYTTKSMDLFRNFRDVQSVMICLQEMKFRYEVINAT